MNNKELISREDLHSLTNEWLKPFIDKCIDDGGKWFSTSVCGGFRFALDLGIGNRAREGGADSKDDHWVIFNDMHDKEHVNIRIFKDHIEFIEDSVFKDFTREEMYSLYEFLKDKIFNKEEEK